MEKKKTLPKRMEDLEKKLDELLTEIKKLTEK